MMSTPDTHDGVYTTESDDRRRDVLMNMAIWHGAKVGVVTLGASSLATYVLNLKSSTFRNYGSINGKVSIPVIVAMFVTSVVTELSIHDARTNPELWDGGAPADLTKKIVPKVTDVNDLSFPKRALLKIYDHPLPFAAMLSLPLAGKILQSRFAQSHLTASQALMQTRVFAQFGVISILMATVSVRLFVNYNDHFGCHVHHLSDEDRFTRGWATDAKVETK
jgi:hypothetical protein